MRAVHWLVVAALVAGLGACASNPARSSAAVPLETPEPPPKPALAPIPSPEPPPERPVATQPVVRPTTPPPPAAAAPANAAPTASTGTPVGPFPVPEAQTPAAELKPAGTAANAMTSVQLREAFERTKHKLGAIDRRRLNVGKRADYDSAQRFLSQADTAAKANNLMLAQSAVEKAEALADGLR